ncbi:MAG: aldehyde ferredoxin oxidoreductase [Spirochaetes bacterium GWD1_61_31]|nr:MAG: aldehyde ferredoxin oxidoreductase [Spirochaetes bacterium GWB1_60_80]OHD34383.1 MAG: aldehyde ferredoxin oxidoreductase [Spirochaetes bacterium GWC1_61_12]OHD35629.1 MAG: aldehyde ferredoxin oxidoreductase [Spirochaetes bacterium GWD1_61_31]OHD41667.1 MAG: aldehyde ferredoxin oxidoreductase [Spirochaetes bacterium GWE1_60_18]OHD61672.1 MAG: aldehyde ferredoxin oxidoreductase [Spirochaetes bacterium GWF1_60_12]HAP42910.1 aldehyde ferredoxin oxidoreductase [Spirochaetaceae bacterium]
MHGYTGKILRVNLTDGSIKSEALDKNLALKYIGGRGLGTALFMKEVKPEVDALGPDNKLLFVNGPLTGTPTPTGGRYMAVTKSPLTGTIASSNSGGYFGAELKFAGWDAIILEGKAAKPSYILIEDDKVELRSAAPLWGKLVSQTTDELEKAHSAKHRILAIGPAGEKLSLIAAIMNDRWRAAGRSGVGAVMGSKNLKAIVVRGSGKVGIADEVKLKEVFSRCMTKIKENGVTGSGLPTYGTAVLVNIINENGVFPTNNFQSSVFPAADDISGETLAAKYLKKKDPCYRCPIACGRYCEVDDVKGGGPEYETIWAFGSDCGVHDLAAVIKANYWCNEYGLDTISAGATLAAAMELYQRGHIKDSDFGDGPKLEFGNAAAVIEWTKRLGAAQGLGAKLALGSYRLTAQYGVPELSMTVKKQELPAYDPRGIQGHGVQYATSNRGGCHVRGYMISPEILGLPEKLDRFSLEGKSNWTKIFQDFTAAIDSVGLCLFTSFAMNADDYADLYNAVCGLSWSGADFIEAGERIWNIERLFNLRAGIGPEQDTLPKRLLTEPIPEGPSAGWTHKLSELLPEYYSLRGWGKDGIPGKEKLAALGIDL